MTVNTDGIMELRNMTGAGIMDCKKALQENNGNVEAALKCLREKGIAKAEKRKDRSTGEGVISSYIHPGSRLGVLLEINCETDFVSRTDEFQTLARDVAMQIAAADPQVVSREELSAEDLEKEKQIYIEQARQSGKPEAVLGKIADGKLEKYYQETCLLDQVWVKNPEKDVKGLIAEAVAKTGENIKIKRFVRYNLGD